MLCVGDETDSYFGSQYEKSVDEDFSALKEIEISRDKLRRWVHAFPEMKVATSNHGMRWAKKAAAAQIPSQMIRAYQDVLELPPSWQYRDRWIIKAKHPFQMIHGLGYSGQYPYKQAAIHEELSTVFGHLHSSAGIAYIHSADGKMRRWGFNTGSLIDVSAFAFHYGRDNRFKPNLGAGVILNGGSTPLWVPYE